MFELVPPNKSLADNPCAYNVMSLAIRLTFECARETLSSYDYSDAGYVASAMPLLILVLWLSSPFAGPLLCRVTPCISRSCQRAISYEHVSTYG
jgi:hypothetical protein